jgi:hypothetical protein
MTAPNPNYERKENHNQLVYLILCGSIIENLLRTSNYLFKILIAAPHIMPPRAIASLPLIPNYITAQQIALSK